MTYIEGDLLYERCLFRSPHAIPSMYDIYICLYIWLMFMVNVGIDIISATWILWVKIRQTWQVFDQPWDDSAICQTDALDSVMFKMFKSTETMKLKFTIQSCRFCQLAEFLSPTNLPIVDKLIRPGYFQ